MYHRDRNTEKRLTHEAREVARRLYEDVGRIESEHIKIPNNANVYLMEDGAFVEAVVWIPLAGRS